MKNLIHNKSYWTAENIKLLINQLGYEEETNALKIGNGVSEWNVLAYRKQVEDYTTADGVDDYTTDLSMPTIYGYYEGLTLKVKFANGNTGTSTIDLMGFGAKTIKKKGSYDLEVGDINAGAIYTLIYDGTNFQITNSGLSSNLEDNSLAYAITFGGSI